MWLPYGGGVTDEEKQATDAETVPAEKAWWDDPRMPWKGKPGRNDLILWAAISLSGVYSLVLLPLRPWLLSLNPYLLALLTGSSTATVSIGAHAAVGPSLWPLGLVLATIGYVKFDPLYWWAGKLWGRGLIKVMGARSPRAARNADRAEKLAQKYGVLAILLAFVLPIPSAIVYAAVGAGGMRLRTFLLVDLAGALTMRALYMYLGFRLGQPAIDVVKVIGDYSMWLALAILAGMIVTALWRRWRRRTANLPQ